MPLHPNCECELADYSGSKKSSGYYPDPELVSDWAAQRVVPEGKKSKAKPDKKTAAKQAKLNRELESLAASIRKKSDKKGKRA